MERETIVSAQPCSLCPYTRTVNTHYRISRIFLNKKTELLILGGRDRRYYCRQGCEKCPEDLADNLKCSWCLSPYTEIVEYRVNQGLKSTSHEVIGLLSTPESKKLESFCVDCANYYMDHFKMQFGNN